MSDINLTIDGQSVTAKQGDTVLQAAEKAGIRIPTLCAHPALEPYGACRLCVVKIEGVRGNPTSCTTPVTESMVVDTKSAETLELRREVLKLMLSGHTSPCLVCSDRERCHETRPNPIKSGKATRCTFCSNRASCELIGLAEELEINEFELPIIYKNIPLERQDPFMDRDYSLCVLCGRCARICKKIQGQGFIEFINRGKDARIGTAFHGDHTETDCRFCGSCIEICPTGSLKDRYAKWYGEPDNVAASTCTLCPIGCTLNVKIKGGKVIGTAMTGFTEEERLCAIGRFVMPQIINSPYRNIHNYFRVEDGLIKKSYEETLLEASEKLGKFKGDQFAFIAHADATREEIYLFQKFTRDLMDSANFAVPDANGNGAEAIIEKIKSGTVKALFLTGNYVDPVLFEKLDLLIAADLFAREYEAKADILFAAAALAEVEGSYLNSSGEIKALKALASAPEGVNPGWKIICDLANKMRVPGFNFSSALEVEKDLEKTGFALKNPPAPEINPKDNIRELPKFFRGHQLAEIADALCRIQAEPEKIEDIPVNATNSDGRFRITEKIEIVPNTHSVTIHAPVIAEKCQAGQFIIVMVNEKSERIPYTISDFDREKGTVTIIALEAGRSSRELANTASGGHLAHVTGPLGMPVEVKNYGTVVVAGGCYGVGAMLPVARVMKEAGNKVICIEEASSHYLLHWEDMIREASDEFIIVTKDGSAGMKGGVQDTMSMLVERGEKVDQAFVIGCTFMMMLVCEVNSELNIPTQTAMNPLMLDGTGMCGACRVSEDNVVKFACVDGPFLDGLKINWNELFQRQSAFRVEEVEGLPQSGIAPEVHNCTCSNEK